jgi:hypothetical protein
MTLGALGRLLARFGIAGVACALAALVTVQYGRIIHRNISYARHVDRVNRDIAQLERKRAEQVREIRRLSDPNGAIPEIHDRLRLVGDHEEIIYLKRPDGAPLATPAPDPDAGL